MIKAVFSLLRRGLALCTILPLAALADVTSLNLKPAQETGFLAQSLWSMFIGCLLLVVAAGCLVFWKRRVNPLFVAGQDSTQVPTLSATKRVSQKTTLYVVRWRGRSYLLSETNGSIAKLDMIMDEDSNP